MKDGKRGRNVNSPVVRNVFGELLTSPNLIDPELGKDLGLQRREGKKFTKDV